MGKVWEKKSKDGNVKYHSFHFSKYTIKLSQSFWTNSYNTCSFSIPEPLKITLNSHQKCYQSQIAVIQLSKTHYHLIILIYNKSKLF